MGYAKSAQPLLAFSVDIAFKLGDFNGFGKKIASPRAVGHKISRYLLHNLCSTHSAPVNAVTPERMPLAIVMYLYAKGKQDNSAEEKAVCRVFHINTADKPQNAQSIKPYFFDFAVDYEGV